jgi:hypothetical protein
VGSRSSSRDYIPTSWYVPLLSLFSNAELTRNSQTELKELIAMHSSLSSHGGDLKNDTVTIIGATLDLQEKVVMQVKKNVPPHSIKQTLI